MHFNKTAPRSSHSFDWSSVADEPMDALPATPAAPEIAGADVWSAITQAFSASFALGLAAGLLFLLTGAGRGGMESSMMYFKIIAVCVVTIPVMWVPMALGVKATAGTRGAATSLLRFVHGTARFVVGLAALGVALFIAFGKIYLLTR